MDIFLNKYLLPVSYLFLAVLVALYGIYAFNKPPYKYKRKIATLGIDAKTDDDDSDDDFTRCAEPSLPRYMTEKSRYNFFQIQFVLISIGLYTLLGALLDKHVLKLMGLQAHPAASYLAAAIIIVGVSSLNINKYDWVKYLLIGSIRKWLHGYANTPKKGQQLFDVLCNGKINYLGPVAQKYIQKLLKQDYLEIGKPREDVTEKDFKVGDDDTIERMWARLSYCIYLVEEGNRQGSYKSHLNEISLGWHGIRKDYVNMLSRVVREKKKVLTDDEQISLNTDLKRLMARTFRMISCLLLIVGRSDEDPIKRLEAVGFEAVPETRYFISSKELFFVILTLTGVIFGLSITLGLGYSLVENEFSGIKFTQIFVFIASGIAIFIVPVVLVLGAKKMLCPSGAWAIAKTDKEYDRPYLLYLKLSVVSWIFTTLLMILLMQLLLFLGYPGIREDRINSSMALYSLISGLTALFVAYRIDIAPRIFKSKTMHTLSRVRGGVIQGLATAMLTWICLMVDMYGGDIVPVGDVGPNTKGNLLIYEVLAFAAGFVLYVSLFFNKHFFERRNESRAVTHKEVKAIIDGERQNIILKNIARGGTAFILDKANILKPGTYVELQDENILRSGVVKSEDNGVMHMAYIFDVNKPLK